MIFDIDFHAIGELFPKTLILIITIHLKFFNSTSLHFKFPLERQNFLHERERDLFKITIET